MLTKMILVGGFLGSGKTTLLHTCASMMEDLGKNVGVITNDQTDQLVDTIYLNHNLKAVKEVSGSCFCCNFNGFADAFTTLQNDFNAEVIFAEPVGSCTDLSATILQPLKQNYKDTIDLAPFTVLADPARLYDILHDGIKGIHPSAAYIIEKQFEEADIILINKKDILTEEECDALIRDASARFADKKILACSAITGEGISAWLDLVNAMQESGTTITSVDYDVYAEGEACLGWLNATVSLQGEETDWNAFLKTLLEDVDKTLKDANQAIGHIKAMITVDDTCVLGNITGTSKEVSIRGCAAKGNAATLTFNARAEIGKDELAALAEEKISNTANAYHVSSDIKELNCLIPGRPNPTYRFSDIIQ